MRKPPIVTYVRPGQVIPGLLAKSAPRVVVTPSAPIRPSAKSPIATALANHASVLATNAARAAAKGKAAMRAVPTVQAARTTAAKTASKGKAVITKTKSILKADDTSDANAASTAPASLYAGVDSNLSKFLQANGYDPTTGTFTEGALQGLSASDPAAAAAYAVSINGGNSILNPLANHHYSSTINGALSTIDQNLSKTTNSAALQTENSSGSVVQPGTPGAVYNPQTGHWNLPAGVQQGQTYDPTSGQWSPVGTPKGSVYNPMTGTWDPPGYTTDPTTGQLVPAGQTTNPLLAQSQLPLGYTAVPPGTPGAMQMPNGTWAISQYGSPYGQSPYGSPYGQSPYGQPGYGPSGYGGGMPYGPGSDMDEEMEAEGYAPPDGGQGTMEMLQDAAAYPGAGGGGGQTSTDDSDPYAVQQGDPSGWGSSDDEDEAAADGDDGSDDGSDQGYAPPPPPPPAHHRRRHHRHHHRRHPGAAQSAPAAPQGGNGGGYGYMDALQGRDPNAQAPQDDGSGGYGYMDALQGHPMPSGPSNIQGYQPNTQLIEPQIQYQEGDGHDDGMEPSDEDDGG